MTKEYIVYMHINKINNKKYIGITCQNPIKRWGKGKGYPKNKHFSGAINKYGWDNFEHLILFDGLSLEEANEKEIELIEKYDTTNHDKGYNISKGGSCGKPISHTDEWNKKIGISRKGYKHTQEAKEKIRQSNIGRHHTNEAKYKIKINSAKAKKVICIETGIIYISVREASRVLNIHPSSISAVCRGNRKTSHGFTWRYIDDEGNIQEIKQENKPVKGAEVLCIETGEIFISFKEASRVTGIASNLIGSCCRGDKKSAGGLHWSYTQGEGCNKVGKKCKKVLCVDTGVIYNSARDAYKHTKIPSAYIRRCCNGERKVAGNLRWAYIE